jgi:cytochrome c oxidase cbb3-type subunit 3
VISLSNWQSSVVRALLPCALFSAPLAFAQSPGTESANPNHYAMAYAGGGSLTREPQEPAASQSQPGTAAQPQPRQGAGFPPAYPVRPPGDPEKIAHGKQLYAANCGFCHGTDARGGETGPNLVRSALVLNDQHSELIRPVVLGGRPAQGMPPIQLADKEIEDIAEFIHAQPLSERGSTPSAPIDILVGDASAGEAYFSGAGKCSTCHSVKGDLAGIGIKYDPKILQNLIVSGGGGGRGFGPVSAPQVKIPPTTVTIATQKGQKIEGTLVRIDAWSVGIRLADGAYRSFALDSPSIKVEVHNPLQAHIDLLSRLQDNDIHNLTKYLMSLK